MEDGGWQREAVPGCQACSVQVSIPANPHLWSGILDSNRTNKIASTSCRNEIFFDESLAFPGSTGSGTRTFGKLSISSRYSERQQLRWYGHVLRMPPERTARKVLLTAPDERRPIGRPRATWIKQINGLCRRAGIEPSETQTLAEDRTEWKRLTTCLTSRPERIMRAR